MQFIEYEEELYRADLVTVVTSVEQHLIDQYWFFNVKYDGDPLQFRWPNKEVANKRLSELKKILMDCNCV